MVRQINNKYITDLQVRKKTFLRKRDSLFNKMKELNSLCGVDACAVIYGNSHVQPEVWPSEFEAHHLLQKVNNFSHYKVHKKMNQEKLLDKGIQKLKAALKKEKMKNRVEELEQKIARIDLDRNFTEISELVDLKDSLAIINEKMSLVNERIDIHVRSGSGSRHGKEIQFSQNEE